MALRTPDIAGLIPHRACRNCMQIKVKCIPRENDSGEVQKTCERCHRLGKVCTTPTPAVRKKRREIPTKVSQLEDRINQLSSLLTPTSSPKNVIAIHMPNTPPVDSEQQRILESSTPKSTTRAVLMTQLDQSSVVVDDDTPILTCSGRRAGSHANTTDGNGRHDSLSSIIAPPHLVAKGDVVVHPAEFCPMYLDSSLEARLFQDYIENFSPFFPFVIIPQPARVRSFKKERPFLFWSAIAVASVSLREIHYTLHERLLQCIGEQMLPKAHKSLDLLQGILILINWYHYYAPINPQMVNLLHLAQALMVDLGLNRPLNHRQLSRVATDISDVYHGRQVIHGTRSSDAKRALLGVFWSASRMALCFERLEPIVFTKHMENCCRDLEANMEHPSDAWIAQMIHLHQIVNKYFQANLTDPELPIRFLKSGITQDINQFLAKLPEELNGRRDILLEVEGCKLCLLGPSHLGNHGIDSDAAEPLYASLVAIKNFTDQSMACPAKDFVALPTWYFFTYVIGALAELSFLNCNSWDLPFVRQEYGFNIIMQQYLNKMEECRDYGNEISSNYLHWRFNMYADRMRRCIKWYEARLNLESQVVPTGDAMAVDATEPYAFGTDILNDFNENDPLWDSIMGHWTAPSFEV